MMKFSGYFAIGLAMMSISLAAVAESSTEPPFDLADPQRIAAGKTRFNALCTAFCHGNEGSGGRVPAFKGNADLKADEVFKVTTEGRRSNDVMPAYGSMSEEKRWELVAYIMHLSRQKPDR